MFFDRYKQILVLAFPVMISQGIQTLLILIDRYILSFKDPILTTAATTAGFAALSLSGFFIYFLSSSTILIAKSFGENNLEKCVRIFTQSILFATSFIPIFLRISYFGGSYFSLLKHPQAFALLEKEYFQMIMLGYIPILFKMSLECYLIGISRVGTILVANIIGLILNTLFCYLFVLGPLSHLCSGIKGAALATCLANCLVTLILFMISPWKVCFKSCFDQVKEYMVQGSYIGFEKFITTFCFVLFVNMFIVYGPAMSAAISIVFTWDQMAFLPLIGMYSALVSLYSQYLGSGKLKEADQMVHAALQIASVFMACFALCFSLFPKQLISSFLHKASSEVDIIHAQALALKLLQTASVYIFIQAAVYIYKGALRSLGFAGWCFRYSVTLHSLLVIAAYIGVYVINADPLAVWSCFMGMVVLLAAVFSRKFYKVRSLAKAEALTITES